MNLGLLAGLTPTVWRRFPVELVCVNTDPAGAGLTQPFLDTFDGVRQFGRYMQLDGIVLVQAQVHFLGATTVGAGGPYAMKLPVRARRIAANAREPLGQAMGYWSIGSPFTNTPMVPILADSWASLGGQQDSYIHFLAPNTKTWGSFSAWDPTVAQTVTHSQGVAPAAYDVQLTQTATGGSSNCIPFTVQNITATTFDVHSQSDLGAGGATVAMSWKVVAEPKTGQGGALAGPNIPFHWGDFNASVGPFGNLFTTFLYEPV